MADTTTNISLTKPEATDVTLIREDFNDNMDLIDAQFGATYLAPQLKNAVAITGGSITGITDLVVADGGTGVSTLTDGGVLLGSGTGAITAMAVLADGEIIVGNGTTDPVAESGATARASLGLTIGTNVQAYDDGLTAIAALAMTDSNMLVGNGTTWVLESGATLLTSIGAAAIAQTMYIGTTQVAINRASAALTLAGITLTTPDIGTPSAGVLTNCSGTAASLTAGAVTNATFTTALTVNTGTLTLTANAANNSVLTIGAGAVSISGANTGDQTNISGNAATVTVADAAADTTTWVLLGTSQTGSLAPASDAGITYNANTNALTTTTFIGALTGQASTVATITGLAPDTATTQAIQASITTCANLTTIGTITTGGLGTGAVVAGVTMTLGSDVDGDVYYRSSNVLTRLPKGTATQVLAMNAGATAPEWVAAGAGYTNLTSFVDQTAFRLFYSDTSGNVTELALGANNTYLMSNGADQAPTFEAGGGGASQLSDLTDVGVTTATDKNALIADGDSWESRALVEADISNLGTATALVADKLSVFAATTSAELTGVISDEIGAGKLRFDTAVTAKTTTATLNVNEAGTILCSAAGGAYTITLPTASGNTGLTYHFIKTDANYTLITLDGDGTETFNYENTTGAPVLTYAQLNTYCAEVTVVSDGANWQCINERLGQVPFCWAYMNTNQINISKDKSIRIGINTVNTDIGSNFNNSTWVSGTATSTSAGHLVDSAGAFTAVMVNKRVDNTTDATHTYITAYTSATDVTVRDDIFVNTEAYIIKHAKFVVPISGQYLVEAAMVGYGLEADKQFYAYIGISNLAFQQTIYATSQSTYQNFNVTNSLFPLIAGDYVEVVLNCATTGDTTDILGNTKGDTFLKVKLISKT